MPLIERLRDVGAKRDRAGNRRLFFDQYRSDGSITRRSFPSTGSVQIAFSRFHSTMKRSDSPPPFPACFASFA